MILFQLTFEPGQERKRIGGSSGEARQYSIVVKAANLLRVCFHDGFAQCDLPVPGKGDVLFLADKEHCGAANAWSFSGHFW
jgi:hypothetical protein